MAKKILVACFSASGVTKKVTEKLAKAAKADLFEIQPAQPYTRADLDWMDKKSRSTVEMNDRSCRPAMAATADIAAYDVVFIGFPVWWYREPSIIDTFLESGDFTGKTVIPFCTSGGSGVSGAVDNMRTVVPGARVADGRRFSGRVSDQELADWAAAWL